MMIQSTEGSNVFAKIDMCHAYWQIPLHESSQEFMSIQIPLEGYSPRRILQGSMDAENYFQSVTSQVFSEIKNVLQWIDYFLLHDKDEQ